MKQLYVNDFLCDLSESAVVALSKQSNDLFDFQNRRANLSNTLRLPQTPRNNIIFNSANDIAATGISRNFYSVRYIQNETEIISKGRGKLISAKGGFYEFAIYWGNINLVEIMEGKTLQDLDLEDLDHDFNLDNIVDLTGDLTYPIINTRITELLPEGAVGSKIDASYMLPAVSMRRIINQILEDNNITLSGDAVSDWVATGRGLYLMLTGRRDLSYLLQVRNSQLLTQLELYFANNTKTGYINMDFFDGTNFVNEFEVEETGTLNVVISLKNQFEAQDLAGGFDDYLDFIATFWYYVEFFDGVDWQEFVGSAGIEAGAEWYQKYTVEENGTRTRVYLQFAINDTILKNFPAGAKMRFKCFYQISDNRPVLITRYKLFHDRGSAFEVGFDKRKYDWEYQVAPNLPAIPQLEILKYIAAETASLIEIEDGTRNIRFKRMNEFINGITEAQDLSGKLESIEVTDFHPKAGQRNILKYNNHETVRPETGEGTFEIANNTLKPINNFYTAPFSASVNQSWNVYQIAHYPVLEAWNDNLADIGARILASFTIPETLNFQDDSTTKTKANKTGLRYNDLLQGFGNAIESNYVEYVQTLNNYKQATAVTKLTEEDFYKLDLMKPVWFAETQNYYLINLVKDFVERRKTTMILTQLQTSVTTDYIPIFPPPPPPPPIVDLVLLLEDEGALLLEDETYLILE